MSKAAARRYANALFELATESKKLKAVETQIEELATTIDESAEFSAFLSSPLSTRTQQAGVIEAMAKKGKFETSLTNTLLLMAQKGRLNLVPDMITSFRELAIESRQEIIAEVTAAAPLSKAQEKKLADTLKAKMGKAVTIETTIDESLIGGLVVKMGSTMIDSSVKGKLSKLHNVMKEVG